MKRNLVLSTIVGTMLLSSSVFAGENTSIGVKFGTFGIGADVKYKFNEQLAARAGFDMYSINDIKIEDEEVTYNFDVKLRDMYALADWHPWKGSFRTSTGLFINSSNVDGTITPSIAAGEKIEFDFNGKHYEYNTEELGSISTIADFDPVAPYLGFGWDTSFGKEKGWGFTFDVGVVFQGSMSTSYSLNFGDALDIDKEIEKETAHLPNGAIKDAKIAEIKENVANKRADIKRELTAELDKEMGTLQDELDKYKILPIVAIGVNYKF